MNETKQTSNDLNDTNTQTDPSIGLAPAESSLDKVRDILFGEQVKENQREFSFLKQQQETLFSNLKDELDRRLESIVHDMTSMRKELDKETIENTHRFNQKLEAVDQTLSELDAGSADLNSQMELWRMELSTELDRINAELSHGKMDRSTLAELLKQMSTQLMDD